MQVEFLLAQIFGLVALMLICCGYFTQNKSKFLLLYLVANFFYALAFIVVEAFVGGIITFISLVRCLYIYLAERQGFKYKFHFLPVFIVLYILTTVCFYSSWIDLIPLCTSIMFTISLCLQNLQMTKTILIIPNSLLVVYNILKTTYTSALLDFVEVIVIVSSLILSKIKKNKN